MKKGYALVTTAMVYIAKAGFVPAETT